MPLNTQYIRYKNTFSSENHIEYIYFFHKHDKDSFMLNESNFLQKFNYDHCGSNFIKVLNDEILICNLCSIIH